jgi:hypothetical protein
LRLRPGSGDPQCPPVSDRVSPCAPPLSTATSPQCTPGITTPATGVSGTAATLNGVINPGGTDTTYTFEYGTTTALGTATTVTDAGSGETAELV